MRKTTHALAVPVALLLAAGIAACGDQVPVTSTDTAAPAATEAVDSETVSAFDVKVGDCLNYDDSSTSVQDVEVVSCDSPHDYEVYNNSDIDDSKYTTAPIGDDLDKEIYDACYDSFEQYVGIPLEESSYTTSNFQPTTQGWITGDRTITCMITSTDGQPLTGSARDSKM